MSLWKEDLVIKNKFSRPAFKLMKVKGVVIHWTANLGASDTGHQSYFDGLDGGGSRYAGAHIFVDSDSATLIIPLNEVAYHANEKPSKIASLRATADFYKNGNANLNTIGLEMCVEKDGTIHKNTVKRSAEIVAELCKKFDLDPLKDVYRHYDITGKNCPAPWVAKPAEFTAFKKTVDGLINAKPAVKPTTKPVSKATKHTVVKGDTFTSIAKQYGLKLADVQKYNARVKATDLKVGDIIHLIPFPETATPNPAPKPVAKPKPVATKLPSNVYGTVKVLVEQLNVRNKADFSAKVVKVAEKGDTFKVYGQKNGLYNIGANLYCTANKEYVSFTKNPDYGVAPKTKTVTVLVGELFTYNTADWNNKGVVVKKGNVFTVAKELTVSGSKMYQLKSGLFITANPAYVKVTVK